MHIKYPTLQIRSIIVCATILLMCSVAQAQYHYMYRGTEVPLTLVSNQVAVRSAAPDAGQAVIAAAASVHITDASPLGIAGWSVVNMAASQNQTIRALATGTPDSKASSAAAMVQVVTASPSVAFATPVFTAGGNETIPTGEILVGLKPGTTIQAMLASLGNTAITGHKHLGGATYQLTTNLKNGLDVLTLANSLNSHPNIAFAEPNFIHSGTLHILPTDPLFSQAWGLHNVGQEGGTPGFDLGVRSAWDVTAGSSEVVVVVFESGIDPSHPDINAISGRDFTDAPEAGAGPRPTFNTPSDNHGTWVAGCISGKAGNRIGATGVAPGVRIASARIGVGDGKTFRSLTQWIVSALEWSRAIGARVTNHSYSTGAPSAAIDAALQLARNAGIVNVGAVGNSGDGAANRFPASSPYCLGVGAANRSGQRASFSNYGPTVDFMAPGEAIITTDRVGPMGIDGDYATVSGTSFSTPYAAGAVSLHI